MRFCGFTPGRRKTDRRVCRCSRLNLLFVNLTLALHSKSHISLTLNQLIYDIYSVDTGTIEDEPFLTDDEDEWRITQVNL